jgi:hypothetical protein
MQFGDCHPVPSGPRISMSSPALAVYRWPSRTPEDSIDIDRRGLLKAGWGGPDGLGILASDRLISGGGPVELPCNDQTAAGKGAASQRWQGPADLGRLRVSFVRKLSPRSGPKPPVIKWRPSHPKLSTSQSVRAAPAASAEVSATLAPC